MAARAHDRVSGGWLRSVTPERCILSLLCGLGHTCAAQNSPISPTQIVDFSSHVITLNSQFFEAQRAGAQPADGRELMPSVWSWKQATFENVCPTLLGELAANGTTNGTASLLPQFPGYFEGGNAVIATGPLAFTASQLAMGTLAFKQQLDHAPERFVADMSGCLPERPLNTSLLIGTHRQLRYMAQSLLATVLTSSDKPEDFRLLTGIGDSSIFWYEGPSWQAPAGFSDLCYMADARAPAANIAAQVSTAMALLAKVFELSEDREDVQLAGKLGSTAVTAFEYANHVYMEFGEDSVCSLSSAATKCVGGGCVYEDYVHGPCRLYPTSKGPEQQLFTTAAALYWLTEQPRYWQAADGFWRNEGALLFNWDNVWAQGVAILSNLTSPETKGVAGTFQSEYMYRWHMTNLIDEYSQCSENGLESWFCRRSEDGYMYPIATPWGNTGSTTNVLCAAALYVSYNFPSSDEDVTQRAKCMLLRQLGYLTNHKCDRDGYACNTASSGGFSYMVGFGDDYPRQIHARDSAFPNYSSAKDDGSTFCGAMVSGPLSTPPNATDLFESRREKFEMTEAALDYSSSVLCAYAGFARLTPRDFEDCGATRTPFTGRV